MHGAKYHKKSVGSFGDISCWSFCQDKIITTGGEGEWSQPVIKIYGQKCGPTRIMEKVGMQSIKSHPPGLDGFMKVLIKF